MDPIGASGTDGGGTTMPAPETTDTTTSSDGASTGSESEADGGATGSAEQTSSDTSSTGFETDDAMESTENTGDRAGDPYGACPCADGSETCIPFSSEGSVVADSCFLLGCEQDDDCPPPESGTANPVCIVTLFPSGACALDCEGDKTCPNGMACYEVGLGGGVSMYRCAWPV